MKSVNKYLTGNLIIILGVSLIWLPFFYYAPLIYINADSPEYYNILSAFEQHSTNYIGTPQIGYSVLLKICELLINKLWFLSFTQIGLNLLSVLLFYFVYYKVFNKNLILVSIILLGYLTSDANLFWDTSIMPDSLLASVFVTCLSLFIYIIMKRKYRLNYVLTLVIVFGISVRPSAIVLLSFLIIILFSLWLERKKKLVFKNLLFIFFSLSILGLVNLYLPFKGSFSLFGKRGSIYGYEMREPFSEELRGNESIRKLSSIVDDEYLKAYKDFENENDISKKYYLYDTYFKRPLSLRISAFDSVSLLLRKNRTFDLNLDSSKILNKKAFYEFKEGFIKKYPGYSILSFEVKKNVQFQSLLFLYFFKEFYNTSDGQGTYLNSNFYSKSLEVRWKYHYVDNLWKKYSKRDWRLVSHNVSARTTKELSSSPKLKMEDFKKFKKEYKGSFIYKNIIQPYYSIHKYLFRNILYVISFLIVFFISIYGVVKSKFKSPLFLMTMGASSIVLGVNILHSIVLMFFNMRYLHQTSFIFYFSLIIMPVVINSFLLLIKNKPNVK